MSLTPEDKQWMAEQLGKLDARVSQKLEDLETKLLTAFHGWAAPTGASVRSHSAEIRALQVNLEALQDRVEKLEGNRH